MQTYTVQVKPGSRKGPLIETLVDGGLVAYVRARAVDGKANEAVIALLAEHFGVPKTRVKVLRGQTARAKLIGVT